MLRGCFVHERHAREWDLPRFAGWWGHDEQSRFEMGPDFRAMPGADGWQLSNPSIVSLAVLRASMDIFHEAGMERLRAKSVSLTGLFGVSAESERPLAAIFRSSRRVNKDRRGAQLSIRIPQNGRGSVQNGWPEKALWATGGSPTLSGWHQCRFTTRITMFFGLFSDSLPRSARGWEHVRVDVDDYFSNIRPSRASPYTLSVGLHFGATTRQVDGNRVRSGVRSRVRVSVGAAKCWADRLRRSDAVASAFLRDACRSSRTSKPAIKRPSYSGR